MTTIRRLDKPKSWIDAYASHDDGQTWSFLSTPEPDTGEGNPPSLLRLADGRLCLIYGRRARPYGILARLSSDQGKTWSDPIVLRDDGGSRRRRLRPVDHPPRRQDRGRLLLQRPLEPRPLHRGHDLGPREAVSCAAIGDRRRPTPTAPQPLSSCSGAFSAGC